MDASILKRKMLVAVFILSPALILGIGHIYSGGGQSQARADAGGGSGCPLGYGCGSIEMKPCCSFVPSCECPDCSWASTPIDIPKGVAGSPGVCIRAVASSPCCEREQCQLDPPSCESCLFINCSCVGSGQPIQLFSAESESSGILCPSKQF